MLTPEEFLNEYMINPEGTFDGIVVMQLMREYLFTQAQRYVGDMYQVGYEEGYKKGFEKGLHNE